MKKLISKKYLRDTLITKAKEGWTIFAILGWLCGTVGLDFSSDTELNEAVDKIIANGMRD